MFTHLHVHTEYSLLDGMCRVPQLISRVKELGMESVALTDHGVMYGAIQFYQEARKAGIKPIIGCEVYISADADKTGPRRENGNRNYHHLILLAKDQTGYRNLMHLVTKAHLEGFYYKPRLTKDDLAEHHEGLVALSACLAGEVPAMVLAGRIDEAKQAALWYKNVFGDFYMELQRHPIPELETVNPYLMAFSRELGIPLVATNDTHYINREDAPFHELLLCVGTNTTIQDPKRMKMAGDFFYLKSPEEMADLYRDVPEALENTQRIADMCNLTLDFGRLHLPEIGRPEGKTPDEYLADLCHEALPRYYPNPSPAIRERLESELEVIRKTQFANYFLVVWDIITFVKQEAIAYGVRGSAAASIVLRCLGITEIDPLENRLVFERFLNIERKEMPDIDMDFEDQRRDEVIAYVSKKYGQDHVAQIITFGTLGARAALRDIGRALGLAYGDVDRVARLVPFAPGMTLKRALDENHELKGVYVQDEAMRSLIDSARKVEGTVRHASTHAAGVVIAKEPLTLHVPLQRVSRAGTDGPSTAVMTQFAMEDIAQIGLLKMDFLGLANLTILRKAVEIIKDSRGIEVDIHHLPMDDAGTFDLLASGETAGVFQLESTGMRRYIKDLKPHAFEEIAAMVALYRPGPMDHIPTYIRAKHGEEPIHYIHPALEDILKETYGVIVYQEQVLFIVRALAGYSLGQADIFRKAMGKKIADVMQKQKASFIAGAVKNGFSTEIAERIFALIEPFAGYAFNKAHAFSYALIAYQTAYLKANYATEYMTALLAAHMGVSEKVASAVAECRRLGIAVLGPDLNRSELSFSIEKRDGDGSAQAIRFGLAAIKNVGEAAIEPVIVERRRGGEFKSVEDFSRRVDSRTVNRRVIESLIKAGALDVLGDRGTLLNNSGDIVSLAQREQRLRDSGQATMFDMWGDQVNTPLPALQLKTAEVAVSEKSLWEKELLGVSLSRAMTAGKKGPGMLWPSEIDPEMDGQSVAVVGEVASVTHLFTREHKPFVKATIEDISGVIETVVWPRVFDADRGLWQEGNTLVVEGKVRVRDDKAEITCDRARIYQPEDRTQDSEGSIQSTEARSQKSEDVRRKTEGNGKNGTGGNGKSVAAGSPASSPARKRLFISLGETEDKGADVVRLRKIVDAVKDFAGEDEVNLCLRTEGQVTNLQIPGVSTKYCRALHERVAELVGEDGVKVEQI